MQRPFVFINAAMSGDGRISTRERRQTRISGAADMKRVDGLRAGADAVMVGVGTVLSDDPGLNVKSAALRRRRARRGEPENPLRVVADSRARTPPDAELLTRGEGARLIFVSGAAPPERVARLRKRAEVAVAGRRRVDLGAALAELRRRGVRRLMVEGGATLNWGLLSEGLVDELCTFVGPLIIGGEAAPALVGGAGFSSPLRLRLVRAERLDGGMLLRWRVGSGSGDGKIKRLK